MRFADRAAAGAALVPSLLRYRAERPLVLGLPRGGVLVAAPIARALGAPLDVLCVRKLGAPGHEELAIGAIAAGAVVLHEDALAYLGVPREYVDRVIAAEQAELARREQRFRAGRPPLDVRGRTVIVVDDGLATGATAEAAVDALLRQQPARLVFAAPVGGREAVARLERRGIEVVCPYQPPELWAISMAYESFLQASDAEVLACLAEAARGADRGGEGETDVTLDLEPGVRVHGDLVVPPDATGLVLFAHGSGSSRKSPRNRLVASALHGRRIATLLFDLLTEAEEATRANVFDIPLLARRLRGAAAWARRDPALGALALGYFGASTGAAAALVAAADDAAVRAVVSRGGRPDLAGDALPRVRAPVLLLVGGDDGQVLALNRDAAARLRAPHELVVVPGATHLFEEPGTLEEVARRAADWFAAHLAAPAAA